MRPETLYTLVCRPALPKDTPDVMELTSTIWEGEDYVPHVWSEWLADPEGLLAVAEYGGRVVGLSKLTRLGPAEWWLEGLRVHPDFEGRGIASHLHEYLLDYWQRTGSGVIRLGTASFRKPVQHLCDRTGFRKVAEYSIFSAPVLPGSDSNSTATNFTPINIDEAQTAVDLALQSPALSLVYGLMDTGWQWATPAAHYLFEAVRKGQAWWWQKPRGLLVVRGEDEKGIKTATIQLIACPLAEMVQCLQDFRQLAGAMSYDRAGWLAALHPELEPILMAAGFQRDWEASLYIYEKIHSLP